MREPKQDWGATIAYNVAIILIFVAIYFWQRQHPGWLEAILPGGSRHP